MPFASVVLPAPRFPIRSATPLRGNSPARRSPRAMVASSVAVRYVGTLLHGVRKIFQNVGGDEALLAERARADFAGEVRTVWKLSEKAGDQAREDVAAAAGSHGGRAGGVDPDAALGEGDGGSLALEHQGY